MKIAKRSKYRAKPVVIDSIRFPSQREGLRYVALKQLERAGEIKELKLQVPFELNAQGGTVVGKYIADFQYYDITKHIWVVEDVKGFRTDLYIWKRKHMKAQYDIDISEVK